MDRTRRMGRHRATSIDVVPWYAHVVPSRDELISSFLVRSAHRHGLSPYRFTAVTFPENVIWTRDIDSSLSDQALSLIAHYYGLTIDDVVAMTLFGFMGCASSSDPQWPACQRWINVIGIYHRLRLRFGLQFCPLCLKDEPVFQRTWRLSFVFACPKHGIFLRDCCPSCEMPVMPHRCKHEPTRCWQCGTLLHSFDCKNKGSADTALAVQYRMLRCLDGHGYCLGPELLSTPEFIHGASIMMRLIKQQLQSHPDLRPIHICTVDIREETRRLRTHSREALFSVLYELLEDWPVNFLHFAHAAGMTQLAFRTCGELPNWLTVAVALLPERLRIRPRNNDKWLIDHVCRLEHVGGAVSWALRAQALMRAAKGIYEC